MRILMIEDNRALADSVRRGLEKEGFAVDLTYTGEDGEEMAFVNQYDVILLDLNLPDKDGIDILKDLRTDGNETPVIIATARDRVDQRALGLDFGADDYVTKPYELLELRARIQAVTRRFHGRTSPVIHIGSLLVNPATRQAEWNGTALELATKEFDVLEYLAVCYPAVVSSEEIGEHIYDDSYDPFSSVLRVHNFVQMPTTNRYNEILTGFNTYTDTAWRSSKSSNTDVTPVYYLKSPDLLDQFNEEAHALGIPDYYEAQTDTLSYNRIVGPVEGLAGVAKTFLIIVLALGSALLILVSILAMRERKYEIGVLRAMGMKKAKVAAGLVAEMLALTVLCLALGFGAGSAAAQPVANGLLQSQIQIAQENEQKSMENYGGIIADSDSNAQALSEIDVGLDAASGAEIALIALGISLLASAAGVAAVTKYEPMKILSERN